MNDDDDLLPPPSFILLEEIATWLLRLLRWLMTGERSPFEAPTPAAAKAKLPPVNHSHADILIALFGHQSIRSHGFALTWVMWGFAT